MKKFLIAVASVISGAIALSFILPLIFAVLPVFSNSESFVLFSGTSVSLTKTFGFVLKSLLFTIKQAFFSMLIALAIGIPMGFFVAKRNFPFRKFLISLSATPFCIPTLLVALSYVEFFGMNGNLNNLLKFVFGFEEPPVRFLYSFTGIIIAQGFYNFPLVMKSCGDLWANIDARQENAATLLGAGPVRRFFTVTIYQISTAITTSAITVFLYCFFSFIIVLLFGAVGCSTIEVEIYQAVKNTLDYRYASLLALVETLTALGLCFLVFALEKKASSNRSSFGLSVRTPIKNPGEKLFFSILMILIVFFSFCPFVSLIISSLESFVPVLSKPALYSSISDSIKTALCTSVLTVTTALFFALCFRLNSKLRNGRLIKLIPLIPLAISSVIVGYGVTIFLQIFGLKSNFFVLSVFQSVMAFPLAFRLITNNLDKVSLQIDTACSMFSDDKSKHIFWVYIPLAKEGIYSAFAFSFAMSCGDTSLPLILSIQDYTPLSLYTFRLASSYQFSNSCAAGIVLMVIGSAFFIIQPLVKFIAGKISAARIKSDKIEVSTCGK